MASLAGPDWLASTLIRLQSLPDPTDPDAANAATQDGLAQGSAAILAPALLQANALPSSLAHPTWVEGWASLEPDAWQTLKEGMHHITESSSDLNGEAILHRHLSAAMLRDERLDLGWIHDPRDPALALCLAPPALFSALLQFAGLMVLGPSIRRIIVRSELATLERQFGAESMEFVRRTAPRLWAGDVHAPRIQVEDAVSQTQLWGGSLLACAFATGAAPVARRGSLRLPRLSENGLALPAGLSEPPQALGVCLALLRELDASWLSHFPALH